jgi:hypothetical protein
MRRPIHASKWEHHPFNSTRDMGTTLFRNESCMACGARVRAHGTPVVIWSVIKCRSVTDAFTVHNDTDFAFTKKRRRTTRINNHTVQMTNIVDFWNGPLAPLPTLPRRRTKASLSNGRSYSHRFSDETALARRAAAETVRASHTSLD